jgi:hypothetical protein
VETVTIVVFGRRRETGLTHGAHLSARGSEEGWVTVRDREDGPQAPLTSGPKGSRVPFLSFFFLKSFSFSVSFIPS